MAIKLKEMYVQYGCGLSAPIEWINFDVSPTLKAQKIPIIRRLVKNYAEVTFPDNVLYGDIIKGLPIAEGSCKGVYSSHTLEHLALHDFRIALQNTYRILTSGGIFRCVVPDLELAARNYIMDLDQGVRDASIKFVGNNTLLGKESRSRGVMGFLRSFIGNSNHLWMWDKQSLSYELEQVGFKGIRKCEFNDCEDAMFKLVEDESRFKDAVSIECRK